MTLAISEHLDSSSPGLSFFFGLSFLLCRHVMYRSWVINHALFNHYRILLWIHEFSNRGAISHYLTMNAENDKKCRRENISWAQDQCLTTYNHEENKIGCSLTITILQSTVKNKLSESFHREDAHSSRYYQSSIYSKEAVRSGKEGICDQMLLSSSVL